MNLHLCVIISSFVSCSDMGKSECPKRIVVCYDRMKELGLVDRCVYLPVSIIIICKVLTPGSKRFEANEWVLLEYSLQYFNLLLLLYTV